VILSNSVSDANISSFGKQFRKVMKKILTPFVWDILRSLINKQIRKRMKVQTLLQSKIDGPIAFCIVHWNAPDFLLLSVNQLELLYPHCSIYILDNGSKHTNLVSILSELKQFNNVTLFSLLGCPNWGKKFGLDTLFDWQTHSAGLQFLLNYSAKQLDEIAVFLDQDCILTRHIDALFSKFNSEVVLIGARDYLIVPDDYGPLKKGRKTRNSYNLIHPSFMILQPNRINQLFGKYSLYDKRTQSSKFYAERAMPEPYHGISFKALGKILYLETSMHAKIPFLTSYVYNGTIYAWHAWYSSRTTGVYRASLLDGLPVSWLQDVRKAEYEFMKQISRNSANVQNSYDSQ